METKPMAEALGLMCGKEGEGRRVFQKYSAGLLTLLLNKRFP